MHLQKRANGQLAPLSPPSCFTSSLPLVKRDSLRFDIAVFLGDLLESWSAIIGVIPAHFHSSSLLGCTIRNIFGRK